MTAKHQHEWHVQTSDVMFHLFTDLTFFCHNLKLTAGGMKSVILAEKLKVISTGVSNTKLIFGQCFAFVILKQTWFYILI